MLFSPADISISFFLLDNFTSAESLILLGQATCSAMNLITQPFASPFYVGMLLAFCPSRHIIILGWHNTSFCLSLLLFSTGLTNVTRQLNFFFLSLPSIPAGRAHGTQGEHMARRLFFSLCPARTSSCAGHRSACGRITQMPAVAGT
jgi:hypothetical protein